MLWITGDRERLFANNGDFKLAQRSYVECAQRSAIAQILLTLAKFNMHEANSIVFPISYLTAEFVFFLSIGECLQLYVVG